MKFPQILSLAAGVMFALNLAAQTNTTRNFTAKVLDDSGQPVAGATVEYYYPNGDSDGYFTLEKANSIVTGNDGLAKFVVPLTWGHILAHKAGMAVQVVACGPEQSSVSVTLGKPESVSGVVVDEAGKPVADAEVSVNLISFAQEPNVTLDGEIPSKCLFARTGTNGLFRIEGFPAGCMIDLTVSKEGKSLVQRPRAFAGRENFTCQAGQQNLKLELQPGGCIEASVEIPDKGFDRSLLCVLLSNPAGRWRPTRAEPGTNGAYRFEDLSPGKYRVDAKFGTNAMPEWVAQTETVLVRTGQVSRVQLKAIKGGILEIATFSSVDHKPVGGARIDWYLQGNSGHLTSENGTGRTRLVPGSYSVSAAKDGAAAHSITFQVKDGETNRVELGLISPRRFSGTVRDTNGAPAVGVQVLGLPWWGGAKTDAAGHYLMTRSESDFIRDPKLCLLVRDRDRNLAATCEIEDGTTNYDLQLAPGAIISGRVEDEHGQPVTNAQVTVTVWAGNSGQSLDFDASLKPNAQGHFEIPALLVGRHYGVSVKARGYGSAETNIEELQTNRLTLETMTLRTANKQIAGTVLDKDKNPVAGAQVSVYGEGQPEGRSVTDENGRFLIDRICEGHLTLNASGNFAVNNYGSAQADAGDKDIVVVLGRGASAQSTRPALLGKPLPDLSGAGIAAGVLQTNKVVLVCLFDPEQRPSRRILKLLTDQHDSLKQKGIQVLGISAAVMTSDALDEWKKSNPHPFPIGGVTEKNDKTQWILKTDTFPWLILTDAQGRVKAEGFELDDLDGKLK